MITAIDKNTALILIDLQNSVIGLPVVHPIDEILDNANKLIAAFREKNLPIIIVNVKPKDAAWIKSRKEVKMPPHSDDENLYKITDRLGTSSDDIFITKHTWNAFFETSLNDELRDRDITGIVFGGVSTSIGVEGTARAASELGYNISFAIDAITDRTKEAHERSVQFIYPRLGEIGNTQEIIQMMNK
jgi:nicotinamidase-related amidase